jgi:hypothetical protein
MIRKSVYFSELYFPFFPQLIRLKNALIRHKDINRFNKCLLKKLDYYNNPRKRFKSLDKIVALKVSRPNNL